MPGLVVNAKQAMKQREAWEPGEYHVILTSAKVKRAATPDKFDQLNLEFTGHAEEGEDYAGRKCYRSLSAKPEAVPFMVDAAIALGCDPEEATAEEVDFEQVFQELLGTECWIVTSTRKYQRNPNEEAIDQTNIDRILSAPSA